MRFKKSLIFDGVSLREARLLDTLSFFGRTDANILQIYYEYNRSHDGRKLSKKKMEMDLLILAQKGFVDLVYYKGDVLHYRLNSDIIQKENEYRRD